MLRSNTEIGWKTFAKILGIESLLRPKWFPSTEALRRHWKRSCWVIDMWRQADRNTMQVADITSCGWNVIDGILSIDWDSNENQATVNERVLLLTKGCKCKTGCTTGRCGCQKKGQSCSEGCACLHCSNLPNTSGKEKKIVSRYC